MSDFLNNLALRSLGSAETVQPRRPAMFERPQAAASLFDPGAVMSESAREHLKEILAERNPEAALEGDLVSRQKAAEPSRAMRPVEDFGARKSSSATPIEAAAASSMFRPRNFAPAPDSFLEPQLSNTRPSPSPLPDSQSDAAQRTAIYLGRTGKDAATDKVCPGGFEPAPKILSEPRATAAEMNPRLPVIPAGARPQAGHASAQPTAVAALPASLRRIIESRLNPRLQAPAAAASSRHAGSSEPAIQVTIGRIEVRASQQAAPAAKRRAPSPVMTLDEYLRRRSQRGGQ